jgi:peroxiredoxin
MENMKKLFTLILGLSTVLIFFAYTGNGVTTYQIGDQVEDFKLQNIDDSWITLSEYVGELGVIVIFTCNTCPYAQLYEDRIIGLHNRFSAKGYPVLAINPNDPVQKAGDSFDKMKSRSKEKRFPFPYVMDAEQTVYPKFGATNTPQVFLLDADLRLRYSGAIDDNPQNPEAVKVNYVENAIEALMINEEPNPAKTKAIGCGIKARKVG